MLLLVYHISHRSGSELLALSSLKGMSLYCLGFISLYVDQVTKVYSQYTKLQIYRVWIVRGSVRGAINTPPTPDRSTVT